MLSLKKHRVDDPAPALKTIFSFGAFFFPFSERTDGWRRRGIPQAAFALVERRGDESARKYGKEEEEEESCTRVSALAGYWDGMEVASG